MIPKGENLMSDEEKGFTKDRLQNAFDRAKLISMQDLFIRNHPEWLERARKEPFPREQMEREWIEHRKKQYAENGGDDAMDFLDALLSDDE